MCSTPCLKKLQNCFCQNFVKFPPILIIFGRKMAKRLKLCEVRSLSTSPNCRHHTTMLNSVIFSSDILYPQHPPNTPVLALHPNCQCFTTKFCINLGNSAWNMVIWFSGKSLNLLPPDVRFKAKMHQIRFLLGELTALPIPLAGFKGRERKGQGMGVGQGSKSLTYCMVYQF